MIIKMGQSRAEKEDVGMKKSTMQQTLLKKVLHKKYLPVFISLAVAFMFISCSYIPEWNFSFDEHSTPGEVQEKGEVALAWDPNTEPDLAGYKLYYGLGSRVYTKVVDVGDQTSYTVGSLDAGKTYYFAVTAYNTSGYISDYSNEVSCVVVVE